MYKVSKYLLMTFGFAAPIMSKLNSYKVCNSTSNNTYIQIQTIGTPRATYHIAHTFCIHMFVFVIVLPPYSSKPTPQPP